MFQLEDLKYSFLVKKVVGELTKVYHDMQAGYRIELFPSLARRADESDLTELFGSVLDSVCE